MENKRGDMNVAVIVALVLGLILIVVLSVGFIFGWNTFAEFFQFGGGKSNVGVIVTQCEIACQSNSVYDFCSRERTLKASDLPDDVKEVTNTCDYFATTDDYEKYAIEPCPGLCS